MVETRSRLRETTIDKKSEPVIPQNRKATKTRSTNNRGRAQSKPQKPAKKSAPAITKNQTADKGGAKKANGRSGATTAQKSAKNSSSVQKIQIAGKASTTKTNGNGGQDTVAAQKQVDSNGGSSGSKDNVYQALVLKLEKKFLAYRTDDGEKTVLFNDVDADAGSVHCEKCRKIQMKKGSLVDALTEWKFSNGCFETDPMEGHYCTPYTRGNIKGTMIKDDYSNDGFRVRVVVVQQFSVVYKDKGDLCYRFSHKEFYPTKGYSRFACTTCAEFRRKKLIDSRGTRNKRTWKPEDSKRKGIKKNPIVSNAGFQSDPRLNHICDGESFEALLKRGYTEVEVEKKDKEEKVDKKETINIEDHFRNNEKNAKRAAKRKQMKQPPDTDCPARVQRALRSWNRRCSQVDAKNILSQSDQAVESPEQEHAELVENDIVDAIPNEHDVLLENEESRIEVMLHQGGNKHFDNPVEELHDTIAEELLQSDNDYQDTLQSQPEPLANHLITTIVRDDLIHDHHSSQLRASMPTRQSHQSPDSVPQILDMQIANDHEDIDNRDAVQCSRVTSQPGEFEDSASMNIDGMDLSDSPSASKLTTSVDRPLQEMSPVLVNGLKYPDFENNEGLLYMEFDNDRPSTDDEKRSEDTEIGIDYGGAETEKRQDIEESSENGPEPDMQTVMLSDTVGSTSDVINSTGTLPSRNDSPEKSQVDGARNAIGNNISDSAKQESGTDPEVQIDPETANGNVARELNAKSTTSSSEQPARLSEFAPYQDDDAELTGQYDSPNNSSSGSVTWNSGTIRKDETDKPGNEDWLNTVVDAVQSVNVAIIEEVPSPFDTFGAAVQEHAADPFGTGEEDRHLQVAAVDFEEASEVGQVAVEDPIGNFIFEAVEHSEIEHADQEPLEVVENAGEAAHVAEEDLIAVNNFGFDPLEAEKEDDLLNADHRQEPLVADPAHVQLDPIEPNDAPRNEAADPIMAQPVDLDDAAEAEQVAMEDHIDDFIYGAFGGDVEHVEAEVDDQEPLAVVEDAGEAAHVAEEDLIAVNNFGFDPLEAEKEDDLLNADHRQEPLVADPAHVQLDPIEPNDAPRNEAADPIMAQPVDLDDSAEAEQVAMEDHIDDFIYGAFGGDVEHVEAEVDDQEPLAVVEDAGEAAHVAEEDLIAVNNFGFDPLEAEKEDDLLNADHRQEPLVADPAHVQLDPIEPNDAPRNEAADPIMAQPVDLDDAAEAEQVAMEDHIDDFIYGAFGGDVEHVEAEVDDQEPLAVVEDAGEAAHVAEEDLIAVNNFGFDPLEAEKEDDLLNADHRQEPLVADPAHVQLDPIEPNDAPRNEAADPIMAQPVDLDDSAEAEQVAMEDHIDDFIYGAFGGDVEHVEAEVDDQEPLAVVEDAGEAAHVAEEDLIAVNNFGFDPLEAEKEDDLLNADHRQEPLVADPAHVQLDPIEPNDAPRNEAADPIMAQPVDLDDSAEAEQVAMEDHIDDFIYGAFGGDVEHVEAEVDDQEPLAVVEDAGEAAHVAEEDLIAVNNFGFDPLEAEKEDDLLNADHRQEPLVADPAHVQLDPIEPNDAPRNEAADPIMAQPVDLDDSAEAEQVAMEDHIDDFIYGAFGGDVEHVEAEVDDQEPLAVVEDAGEAAHVAEEDLIAVNNFGFDPLEAEKEDDLLNADHRQEPLVADPAHVQLDPIEPNDAPRNEAADPIMAQPVDLDDSAEAEQVAMEDHIDDFIYGAFGGDVEHVEAEVDDQEPLAVVEDAGEAAHVAEEDLIAVNNFGFDPLEAEKEDDLLNADHRQEPLVADPAHVQLDPIEPNDAPRNEAADPIMAQPVDLDDSAEAEQVAMEDHIDDFIYGAFGGDVEHVEAEVDDQEPLAVVEDAGEAAHVAEEDLNDNLEFGAHIEGADDHAALELDDQEPHVARAAPVQPVPLEARDPEAADEDPLAAPAYMELDPAEPVFPEPEARHRRVKRGNDLLGGMLQAITETNGHAGESTSAMTSRQSRPQVRNVIERVPSPQPLPSDMTSFANSLQIELPWDVEEFDLPYKYEGLTGSQYLAEHCHQYAEYFEVAPLKNTVVPYHEIVFGVKRVHGIRRCGFCTKSNNGEIINFRPVVMHGDRWMAPLDGWDTKEQGLQYYILLLAAAKSVRDGIISAQHFYFNPAEYRARSVPAVHDKVAQKTVCSNKEETSVHKPRLPARMEQPAAKESSGLRKRNSTNVEDRRGPPIKQASQVERRTADPRTSAGKEKSGTCHQASNQSDNPDSSSEPEGVVAHDVAVRRCRKAPPSLPPGTEWFERSLQMNSPNEIMSRGESNGYKFNGCTNAEYLAPHCQIGSENPGLSPIKQGVHAAPGALIVGFKTVDGKLRCGFCMDFNGIRSDFRMVVMFSDGWTAPLDGWESPEQAIEYYCILEQNADLVRNGVMPLKCFHFDSENRTAQIADTQYRRYVFARMKAVRDRREMEEAEEPRTKKSRWSDTPGDKSAAHLQTSSRIKKTQTDRKKYNNGSRGYQVQSGWEHPDLYTTSTAQVFFRNGISARASVVRASTHVQSTRRILPCERPLAPGITTLLESLPTDLHSAFMTGNTGMLDWMNRRHYELLDMDMRIADVLQVAPGCQGQDFAPGETVVNPQCPEPRIFCSVKNFNGLYRCGFFLQIDGEWQFRHVQLREDGLMGPEEGWASVDQAMHYYTWLSSSANSFRRG